ncbi:MAG: nucleoside recognition protein [Methanothrix sp.]|nr:nucleoside recognition protein [Methanothrix sp.]HUM81838.1 nucleoside recognition protein [Methanothrix sp.]
MLDLLLQALGDTFSPMSKVFIMLFFTGFLLELDAFSRISRLAGPLVSVSHLPAVSASSFVVSLGSALAANTMIAKLKEEGHLSERQAFLSAIMNSVPVYFRELFTYQLAFVIPVLGIFVGGAYALISVATGLIKLTLVMILGRTYLDADAAPNTHISASCSAGTGPEGPSFAKSSASPSSVRRERYRNAARNSLQRQKRIFLRIASLYFIMTFLVLYLSQEGILQSLDVAPLARLFSIPPETIIPLTIYVASPKAGITLLGPLIQNGGITEIKAIMVLMLGSLFMLPFYALRSLLPNYTGVFGLRMGLSLVFVSTSISLLVRMSVLVALLIAT